MAAHGDDGSEGALRMVGQDRDDGVGGRLQRVRQSSDRPRAPKNRQVRDLPITDRPVRLVWAKRIWPLPGAVPSDGHLVRGVRRGDPRAVLTERAEPRSAVGSVLESSPWLAVARSFGVCVLAHRHDRSDRSRQAPCRSPRQARRALGDRLDETSFLAVTRWSRAARDRDPRLDTSRLIAVLPARAPRQRTAGLGPGSGSSATPPSLVPAVTSRSTPRWTVASFRRLLPRHWTRCPTTTM